MHEFIKYLQNAKEQAYVKTIEVGGPFYNSNGRPPTEYVEYWQGRLDALTELQHRFLENYTEHPRSCGVYPSQQGYSSE